MKPSTLSLLGASAALALTLTSPLVLQAQDARPGGGNRNRGEENGGNNDNRGEEFRKRMVDYMKGQLKVTDEEWTVLEPMIEKVREAQRASGTNNFGGMRNRGGGDRGPRGGGGGGGGENNPGGGGGGERGERGGGDRGGSPEQQALRTALQNESTSPEELKTKLNALRASRKKAQGDLQSAREDLRKVLTARQEAVLVSIGLLD